MQKEVYVFELIFWMWVYIKLEDMWLLILEA